MMPSFMLDVYIAFDVLDGQHPSFAMDTKALWGGREGNVQGWIVHNFQHNTAKNSFPPPNTKFTMWNDAWFVRWKQLESSAAEYVLDTSDPHASFQPPA